ncbi:methionine--tRNA ligase [Patescibacteria group bacterium]|nr:methionine--tRNA ligase [Patescibacteria group bacterium]
MNKFYITTPIYYVNSVPHIGHAYTTIVADVLARYYRLKLGNENVFFLTGTDEHGAKVGQAAGKAGKTPQEFVDEVSAQFRTAWENLNISNNDFIRTTESRHEKVVNEILLKLKDSKTPKGNDFVYKDIYEGLYCVGCESYKKPEDLIDGKCPDHNIEPEYFKEENWYFRLSDFAEMIREKIENDEIRVLPDERKREVLGFIDQGLENIAISREQVKWGITLPFDDTQTIYVWVDALINYISALGFPDGENFKKFWPANIQLLGKDILKFHCIIWPAILIAAGIELPKDFFVHGYFTIDGKKMSKTIGNVIDSNDLVNEFGVDAARYLIISQFAFGQDGDVRAEEFKVKFNADLANGLGNLVSRVLAMVEKYCEGKVPEKEFNAVIDLKKIRETLDKNYADYKIFENLKEIWNVIAWCDGYVAEKKPWTLAKENKQDELEQVLYNSLEVVRHLAYFVLPILPETGKEILRRLGEENIDYEKAKVVGGLKSGQTIEKGEALFLRK